MEEDIEAAKKEGKVVAGGPPTAVLRKQFKETFENTSASNWNSFPRRDRKMPARRLRIQSRGELLRRAARRLGHDGAAQE